MANIIDYLKWRGDLSFLSSSFNQIDNLILSQFSYYPFEVVSEKWNQDTSIPLGQAAESLLNANLERYSNASLESDREFLEELKDSVRFRDALLSCFVNSIDYQKEKQFSAIQVSLSDDTDFIVFRGTDNTLVGWKEDLNMAFEPEVPAQKSAMQYLNQTAKKRKKLRIGGHSKGGNLAVYAAAFCNKAVQNLILNVYNNDGPGFNENVIHDAAFQSILERIHSYIPQSSLVGRLMEHTEKLIVIESSELGGINQHDPFSWQVLGNRFVKAKQSSGSSLFIDSTLKTWMKQVGMEERRELIDGIFTIFEKTEIKTLDDLAQPANSLTVLKALKEMDEKTNKVMRDALAIMGKAFIEESPLNKSFQRTKAKLAENINSASDMLSEAFEKRSDPTNPDIILTENGRSMQNNCTEKGGNK